MVKMQKYSLIRRAESISALAGDFPKAKTIEIVYSNKNYSGYYRDSNRKVADPPPRTEAYDPKLTTYRPDYIKSY